MTLVFNLYRIYNSYNTMGYLVSPMNRLLCFSNELVWKDNQRRVSCIPEGEFPLLPRFTKNRGNHIMIGNTAPREFILVHSGNETDLREENVDSLGCILPACNFGIDKNGRIVGLDSTKATKIFTDACYYYINRNVPINLRISRYENTTVKTLWS